MIGERLIDNQASVGFEVLCAEGHLKPMLPLACGDQCMRS